MCNQEGASGQDDSSEQGGAGGKLAVAASAAAAAPGVLPRFLRASLPLVLLGASSGVTCPCYLASVGLFQAKFGSELLFASQVAVVVLAHLAAVLVEEVCAGSRRPPLGVLLRQLAVFSTLASLALLHTPACGSVTAVLLHGALISALGTWLFGASVQLGTLKGGVIFVNAGFALGSLAAALLVSACRLGPAAPARAAYGFYGVAAAVCAFGSWLWLWNAGACCGGEGGDNIRRSPWDGEASELSGDGADDGDDEEGAARRPLAQGHPGGDGPGEAGQGYQTLLGAGSGGDGSGTLGSLGCTLCGAAAWGLLLAATGVFFCHAAGLMLVPLLTLAGPEAAVLLYQMKCLGDCFGRLAAAVHSADCAAAGKVGRPTRCVLLGTAILVRPLAALPVVAWLLAAGRRSQVPVAPQWFVLLLLVGIFSLGGYSAFMLDLDAQLSLPPSRRRCGAHVARLATVLGHGAGLSVGVLLAAS